jgi:hypothetical protein
MSLVNQGSPQWGQAPPQRPKKKSALPILLVGAALVGLAALLVGLVFFRASARRDAARAERVAEAQRADVAAQLAHFDERKRAAEQQLRDLEAKRPQSPPSASEAIQQAGQVHAGQSDLTKQLMHAVLEQRDFVLAQRLVDQGADVNVVVGIPLLSVAAGKGDIQAVEFLLRNRANPNLRSMIGARTAMHEGAKVGHLEIVASLLAAGATPCPTTNKGLTPLAFAEGHSTVQHPVTPGHLEVIDVLRRVGCTQREGTPYSGP